jgi:hypothetical protein
MASTPLRHISECLVSLYHLPDTPLLLVTFCLLSLHGALLPLNVADLFELEIRRVDRHQSMFLGVQGRQPDFGVDVEQALNSARRPGDNALHAEHVRLEVIIIVRAVDSLRARNLVRVTRKVVSCLAGASITVRDVGVATVVRLEDRKLPALRVLELDVELAVFAIRSRGDAWASLRNELVVEKCQSRQIGRQLTRNRARRAAGARKGDSLNFNLVAAWAIPLCDGGGANSDACEKGNDVAGLHFGENDEYDNRAGWCC